MKFLGLAWLVNSEVKESRAYDLIGMQYYYMGNLEAAEFYHNKMNLGEMEPKDSSLRDSIVRKLDLERIEKLIAGEFSL